jgi:GTP-binding protein
MTTTNNQKIRNIAVIAHVDHGKTTLVDALLKQTHVFRDNQAEMLEECILDSNDLERERGITIMAKTCAVEYQGYKINIIDTPGHADFSGEVERTLSMADGALLIIDAQEGPMPQTRFVLKKALELDLKIIVVINKLDKRFARIDETLKRLETLFLELVTKESHLNFTVLYAIGRTGIVLAEKPTTLPTTGSVEPLLKTIIEVVPPPKNLANGRFQLLVSALDYDPHLGQMVIGKIHQGTLRPNQTVINVGNAKTFTVSRVMVNQGIDRVDVDEAVAGDIVILTGLEGASIGATIASPGDTDHLEAPVVAEPTLHLSLGPNTSPFSGREGKFTTSRQLGERLTRELKNNVGLRIEELDNGQFVISGRGELHLSVLLETMRREGYEMEVGKPEAITKVIGGVTQEPIEELDIIVPQAHVGTVNQELGKRQANLVHMEPINDTEVDFIYRLPTRALIGLRSVLLTLTKGTAVLNSQILGYEPAGPALPQLRKGVLIAAESGKAVEYGLRALKNHGIAFVVPGTDVYEGMVVGVSTDEADVEINVCKEKNLTNHRKKSHQGITILAPDMVLSLEQALDFVEKDELLEITPQSLRIRKKYLTALDRHRAIHPRFR